MNENGLGSRLTTTGTGKLNVKKFKTSYSWYTIDMHRMRMTYVSNYLNIDHTQHDRSCYSELRIVLVSSYNRLRCFWRWKPKTLYLAVDCFLTARTMDCSESLISLQLAIEGSRTFDTEAESAELCSGSNVTACSVRCRSRMLLPFDQ